jgi:energy-coupling factor transporter ATP-binding protein EcfA2
VSAPLLSLSHVTYRHAGASTPALVDVTLEVSPGEVVALTGAPGAGATTFLLVAGGFAPRLIGGTLEGTVHRGAARPGIVFAAPWTQLTGLCQTVLAEVAFGPAGLGLPRQAVRVTAERALERLGVLHLAERDPATLSGGELQRVIVAAALALEPDLLLLDDPAAELDPAGADALYDLLPGVAAAGAVVLVATPDAERAARAATRAVRLDGGRVVADGAPAAVLTDTPAARIALAAGCPVPLPLDAEALVARVAR